MQQHTGSILSRIVALKDVSPFVLLQDAPEQTAKYVLLEFVHRNKERSPAEFRIVYLSFETPERAVKGMLGPVRNVEFVACRRMAHAAIHQKVASLISSNQKSLIVIDSLNSIRSGALASFIAPLIRPHSTLVAVLHNFPTATRYDMTKPTGSTQKSSYAPSLKTQLLYLATTIITVSPTARADIDEDEIAAGTYLVPLGAHARTCLLEFVHRRKSGRAVEGTFEFDFARHEFTYLPPRRAQSKADDGQGEALIDGLTTFNLGTTEKQRLARENVELPYLAAQEGEVLGASVGGAIVYQFEKEDDYDEEDPYEDPF
ncbi:elongator complex protein 5 [Myxozyma melibiosi]|uniref:Elongator complex protein 5 n=1 Tax=Myxozyma melibiosi TaxID=54550 RepID=A0ABR1F3U2_9ASCO